MVPWNCRWALRRQKLISGKYLQRKYTAQNAQLKNLKLKQKQSKNQKYLVISKGNLPQNLNINHDMHTVLNVLKIYVTSSYNTNIILGN